MNYLKATGVASFNPTYNGDGFKRNIKNFTHDFFKVSILPITEMGLKADGRARLKGIRIGFNPTYNGDGFKSSLWVHLWAYHFKVSILPITEMGLKDTLSLGAALLGQCFNPTYNGDGFKRY